MVKKCVVPKCRSGLTSNEKVSMFRVPKNKIEIWQRALPTKNRPLTVRDAVCERHFKPSDIIREIQTPLFSYSLITPKLAPGAIPSTFPITHNYPLRPRPSKDQPTIRKKPVPTTSKSKSVLTRDEMLQRFTREQQLETVSELEFKIKLQEVRRTGGKNGKSLSRRKYAELVSEVLAAKKNNSKLILQKYDVIFNDKGTGILTSGGKERLRYYVHDDELFHIFRGTHLMNNHGNEHRMIAELKNKYKNIALKDIVTFLSLCPTCNQNQKIPNNFEPKSDMVCTDLSSTCSVNFIDYGSCPDGDYCMVMVYQNHFSNFCLLKPLKSDRALEVVPNLLDIFGLFGISKKIQSSKGNFFWRRTVDALNDFIPDLDIKFVKTYPENPIAREVDLVLREWMHNTQNTKWVERLPIVQFQQNSQFNDFIDRVPYCALFNVSSVPHFERSIAEVKTETTVDSNEVEMKTIEMCAMCSEGETCLKCRTKMEVRHLLPPFYQNWEEPSERTTSEEEYWETMRRSGYKRGFSKKRYDDLVDRLSKCDSKRRLPKEFCLSEVNGIRRLTSPKTGETVKCYIHDEELFYILHYTHINLNHLPTSIMFQTLELKFQNIARREVSTYVKLCPTCKSSQEHQERREHVVYSNELSTICSVNLLDYESQPDGEFKYVLVYRNSLTKFCMLQPLKTKNPEEVATRLVDIFSIVGTPGVIESRREPDFEDEVIKRQFLRLVMNNLKSLWPGLKIIRIIIKNELEDVESIDLDIKDWMEKNGTVKWSNGLAFVQLMRNRQYDLQIEKAPYDAFFDLRNEIESERDENIILMNLLNKLYPFNYKTIATTTNEKWKYLFWERLYENRRKNRDNLFFPKQAHEQLITRILKEKENKQESLFNRYRIIKFQGTQRVIESDKNFKFHFYDEELFTIFHYTHLRLGHAEPFQMKKELDARFTNIRISDLKTFCNLCSRCSEKIEIKTEAMVG